MFSSIHAEGSDEQAAEGVTEFLLRKVLTVNDVRAPEDLVNRLARLGTIGEVLWILRPMIYSE